MLQPACLSVTQAWEVCSLTSRSGLVQSIPGHYPGSRARQLKHGQDSSHTRKKETRTSRLVCCSCLLSVRHLAVFTVASPHARSWQTDRRGDDQTTRPPVVKRTRHVENAAWIVRKLTRRQARGRPSHQYGPVTVPVTTLTHSELIINAN